MTMTYKYPQYSRFKHGRDCVFRSSVATNRQKLLRWVTIKAILLSCLSSACALPEQEPNKFHYLSPDVVQTDMQEMANQVAGIALIVLNDEMTETQRRVQVVSMLDQIETIAAGLRGGSREVTNYSVINRYMGAFLYDVGIAREFAQREPVNLVPAGRLVNSCLSCHDSF